MKHTHSTSWIVLRGGVNVMENEESGLWVLYWQCLENLSSLSLWFSIKCEAKMRWSSLALIFSSDPFLRSFNGKVTARDLHFLLNIVDCTLESVKRILIILKRLAGCSFGNPCKGLRVLRFVCSLLSESYMWVHSTNSWPVSSSPSYDLLPSPVLLSTHSLNCIYSSILAMATM